MGYRGCVTGNGVQRWVQGNGVQRMGAREWGIEGGRRALGYRGWVPGNGEQKGHTESESCHCRRSEPTGPQKFCKGLGLLSPSHTI